MPLTAHDWPIAASVLNFAPADPGRGDWPDQAEDVLTEVADAGFDHVDLTDSWVRPGDLGPRQLDALSQAAASAGIAIPSISAIRRSVIDARDGLDNLAYSHRTLDAAAALGVGVVSFGLHQALTPAQREALWFWRVEGHRDPEDTEIFALAVRRFQELGRHAADLGLLVSLEMYEHTYLGTSASAVRLVEEIGMPEVGLNPDIGNLIRLPGPIEDWREMLERTLPYTNFWHAKNYSRDEDPATGMAVAIPSTMEMGLISYREAVKLALAHGFQGVICLENYGGDGLSVCATNREYLRRVLPRRADYALGVSRVDQQALVAA
ncbi:sugar phosphate isomerase/epimerase [Demequina sp. NBRC 110053]|uniref:sugar phosphate isomerase/epimerase family protein n=1 Tax=Demequina sp. NBRC 110053 TaxID=1570342 RepID=UPI000A036EF1|nr:sugar phosphate isomerase/epimerase family protein [Demequina sp. NBRC 110053]